MKAKTVITTFAIFATLNGILLTCVYLVTLPFVNDIFWPADIKKVLELPKDERLFFTIIVVLIEGFLFNISHKEAEAQERKSPK